ncbi:hypothetical protein BOTBODRAFT_179509 [Botryobasidium botryosum FD-172 SS1]|uniref:AB hydrolase-1 domain-containing protein n=1 Tax=Botryobasidium botryosum (strain FD-172 SS1) TaxID=930990 RepID=A0A067M2G0_BOTB1|nr:hypothetical protein BOTBODRAFT_179509 [Botryobasidium botryosum FD-172 SS1]
MNPSDPSSFHHRIEKLSTGHTYHFVDQVPENYSPETTPTLLLVHGFPEFWYTWRYQIGPWVRKRWRVVAPDMIGYGQTEKPSDLQSYTSKSICDDLAALLDCIGVSKAVLIGHDWGAHNLWRFCLWHPDRVRAMIAFAIPFFPPSPDYIETPELVKLIPDFGYRLYFEDAKSTKEIEDNLSAFFTITYRRPRDGISITKEGDIEKFVTGQTPLPPQSDLLEPQEWQYCLETFSGAMDGPLSYYRAAKLNFEDEKRASLPSHLSADIPALFIHPTFDPTCNSEVLARSKKLVPTLEIIPFEGSGHWVMTERKGESAEVVIRWINSL